MSKNIKQYLTRYAEPMINILGSFPRKHHYENCIVIPAYKERVDFVERFLCSSLSQQNSLVIIVINQPSYDDNEIPQQTLT